VDHVSACERASFADTGARERVSDASVSAGARGWRSEQASYTGAGAGACG
jgi:hypothetical protein